MKIVSSLMELIIPSCASIKEVSENRQWRRCKVDQQKDSAAEFGFSRRSLLQATTLGAAGAALAPALSAGRVFASPLPTPSAGKPFAFITTDYDKSELFAQQGPRKIWHRAAM